MASSRLLGSSPSMTRNISAKSLNGCFWMYFKCNGCMAYVFPEFFRANRLPHASDSFPLYPRGRGTGGGGQNIRNTPRAHHSPSPVTRATNRPSTTQAYYKFPTATTLRVSVSSRVIKPEITIPYLNLPERDIVRLNSVVERGLKSMKRTKAPPPKKSLSLNELAREQGVSPVKDIQEISDLWPVDDDPDELLRFTLLERRARRQRLNGRK